MRRFIFMVALVIIGLLALNGCVVEATGQLENQQESPVEVREFSTIYDAVSVLFDKPVEASYTAVVRGIVINAYKNIVLAQDIDGKAGLRIELIGDEILPVVGNVLIVQGNLRKYERDYITTFKMQEATYEILDEGVNPMFNELTGEYFKSDNNYKMHSLVHATGTVSDVKTGEYPKIYLEIKLEDSTKEVIVFSFDPDVRGWINSRGNSLIGRKLYVKGYWSKYKDDWEIIPRDPSDIPVIVE